MIGRQKYNTVVIPPSLTSLKRTVELLQSFQKAGGKVLFLGRKPQRIDGNLAQLGIAGASFDTVDEIVPYLDQLYAERMKKQLKMPRRLFATSEN